MFKIGTPTPISREVIEAVHRSFPDSCWQEVLDQLRQIGSEWTRQAILVLAHGDSSQFRQLVELNELDYREIPSRLESFYGLPAAEVIRRRTKLGLSLPRTSSEKNAERQRQEVIGFIAENLIVSVEQLSDTTELQRDLQLQGTRGDRFIRDFSERFSINLDRYNRWIHFDMQPGEDFWADLKSLVLGRRQRQATPITVADLLVAVQLRQWPL